MNKTVFIFPLPTELQFKIFEYEHISIFKKCLDELFIKCDLCSEYINIGDTIHIECGTIDDLFRFYFYHKTCIESIGVPFKYVNNFWAGSRHGSISGQLTTNMFIKISNNTFLLHNLCCK